LVGGWSGFGQRSACCPPHGPEVRTLPAMTADDAMHKLITQAGGIREHLGSLLDRVDRIMKQQQEIAIQQKETAARLEARTRAGRTFTEKDVREWLKDNHNPLSQDGLS